MKISLNWLKNYVTVHVSADQLARRLTMAGLEVEKTSSVKGDVIFELEITPNRPDCLNIVGIAREVSAIFNKPLKKPQQKKVSIPKQKVEIHIENTNDCRRYIGALIEHVQVASSCEWLKKRLDAIDIRSINNVVDITNFCLMELGQPLHAFDFDKLIGGKIFVRRAKEGETIVTIDEVERKLDPSILVIADIKRPVAIAGVMGGKETEVTETTKNILLESAYFDPLLIRRASRKLGLTSDSSYRFERGVDMTMVGGGSRRAMGLIVNEAKGTIKKYADVFPGKSLTRIRSINVSLKRINTFLDTGLSLGRCVKILKKLGFLVTTKKESIKVSSPSFRGDIKCPEDVMEEIARIVGYDEIPLSYPPVAVSHVKPDSFWNFKQKIQEILLGQGLDEIITYSTTSQMMLEKSNLRHLPGIKILNPLTKEQEVLRPSLLPSFLSVVVNNFNRGQKDLRLFEIGKIYEQGYEKEMLGILLVGNCYEDWRISSQEPIDFYDIKGIVDELWTITGLDSTYLPIKDAWLLEAIAAAAINIGEDNIGFLGKIKNQILANWDIKQKDIYFAQLDIDKWYKQSSFSRRYQELSEFPAIVRDVSLAVKKDIHFHRIKEIAYRHGKDILSSIKFIEQYVGNKIPVGQKGLVFSLVYQSRQRTLREDEVIDVHERICQSFINELGATRR